jgi:hypothetical protein
MYGASIAALANPATYQRDLEDMYTPIEYETPPRARAARPGSGLISTENSVKSLARPSSVVLLLSTRCDSGTLFLFSGSRGRASPCKCPD